MPLLGMVRHVVVADTDAAAHALAAPAYARWFDTVTYPWRARGIPTPSSLPATFEDAVAAGQCLAGSSATVRNALVRQIGEAGVTYVLCHLAFGDLPATTSLNTVAAIEAEIMPVLAEAQAMRAGTGRRA